MMEAALALSEQKSHDVGELLTRVKVEKEEQRERQSRERRKEQEVGPGGRRENAAPPSSRAGELNPSIAIYRSIAA